MPYVQNKDKDQPTPAPVAQLEERPLREQGVAGSSPGRDIPKSLKMVLAAPCLALRLMVSCQVSGA